MHRATTPPQAWRGAGGRDSRRGLRRAHRRWLRGVHDRVRRGSGPDRQGQHLPPLARPSRTWCSTRSVARFGGPDDVGEGMLTPRHHPRPAAADSATADQRGVRQAAEAIRAVAWEVTRDAGLAAAVERKVHRPKQRRWSNYCGEASHGARCVRRRLCELYADVLPALLTYRMVLNNQPVTASEATDIVDHVVMPLISTS